MAGQEHIGPMLGDDLSTAGFKDWRVCSAACCRSRTARGTSMVKLQEGDSVQAITLLQPATATDED